MIIFKNEGKLEIDSIVSFGVCVKESDNPIGYFGTGLKYAISVLLRTGHTVEIHTCGEVYKFETIRKAVRGKEFEFVGMNGSQLGFTTELGKNWEVWQAFRELYCNCLDEGGEAFSVTGTPDISDNETMVAVSGTEIETAYHEKHTHFIDGDKGRVFESPHADIHKGPCSHVYYRGVRALDLPAPSMFKYNIWQEMKLTEDRTIADIWDMKANIGMCIAQADYDIALRCITAERGCIEHDIDYDWGSPSEGFLDAVEIAMRDRPDDLNDTAKRSYQNHRKANVKPTEYVPHDAEVEKIENAMTLLEKIGVTIEYPIVYVESLGQGILAKAQSGKIHVTRECLMMGDTTITGMLYEEYLHLKHGFRDESRALQTHLFLTIATLLERL